MDKQGYICILLQIFLISTVVTIRLEQELYTVNEDAGILPVCALIVDGSLNRPVSFNLSVFSGPGAAVGESHFRIYITLTFHFIS